VGEGGSEGISRLYSGGGQRISGHAVQDKGDFQHYRRIAMGGAGNYDLKKKKRITFTKKLEDHTWRGVFPDSSKRGRAGIKEKLMSLMEGEYCLGEGESRAHGKISWLAKGGKESRG